MAGIATDYVWESRSKGMGEARGDQNLQLDLRARV
jgi:hypothetical protein